MKRPVQRAIAAAVIGLGVTGGVVMAQAPTTTPATGTAVTQPAGQPPNGNGPQGPAGMQGGPGGPGGPGRGPGGQRQAPTTDSVTKEITNLTQSITSIKADRDFAN